MEKIKFTLYKPRGNKVIFIEEQEENKLLFEYIGDFPKEEKQDKIMTYKETLKEIYKLLNNSFEIMAF
ncbi:hypothetical protein [Fusobacterium sp.]|uniref:hypothetical protein n=1 Tax=Fusobacterium sp. TaxID=68766 RepID=UPI002E75F02D|nr:hypothetical protein [Fusobacterium sp.]MEE1475747.1 hypothetical protein [Fusobacterium sp.]